MEFTYAHVGYLQESVRDMSKKDAIDHILHFYPHLDENWLRRKFQYLMALDPVGLVNVLTYGDPTGNTAVRHVLKEMTQ